jgi:hypothetical protein
VAFVRVIRLALGPIAVALIVASFPALVTAAGSSAAATSSVPAGAPLVSRSLDARITVLRPRVLAQAAVDWRGGEITTSTGEVVRVLVSETFALEQASPETWAEFLAGLLHGPELQRLTTYVAPLSEVQRLCGAQALGCYSRDRAVAIGETLSDGTTAAEVIRHEYGHHIALYRSNPPWVAVDWGPKRWASAANVCARVSRKEAFPGNEGSDYARNPGEAWAEVYRLLDERRAGITTAIWQIVAPSFYPDESAFQAAERDVVEPWTAGQRAVKRRQLTRRGQVWWVPLSTALDGSLQITVTVPRGGLHEVALVGANRRTILRRGLSSGPRVKRITGNVCGQRSLYVRVTQRGTLGQVTVAASYP